MYFVLFEHRQLTRDREELEDIHKSRMDRIKAREESLLERMLSKEKVRLSSSISLNSLKVIYTHFLSQVQVKVIDTSDMIFVFTDILWGCSDLKNLQIGG